MKILSKVRQTLFSGTVAHMKFMVFFRPLDTFDELNPLAYSDGSLSVSVAKV